MLFGIFYICVQIEFILICCNKEAFFWNILNLFNNNSTKIKKGFTLNVQNLDYHFVGPTGLEPVPPCSDNHQESQVLLTNLLSNSGYCLRFLIYADDFIDFIFLSIRTAFA